MKIGDTVKYTNWSRETHTAKVERIELCTSPGTKYGKPVDSVNNRLLYRCCIDLDNGHWCYGDQIKSIL